MEGQIPIEEESSEAEKSRLTTGSPSVFTLEQFFINPHLAIFNKKNWEKKDMWVQDKDRGPVMASDLNHGMNPGLL